MTASVKNTIRIVIFVAAMLIAVLFAEHAAHADDAAAQATPAPDAGSGTGSPTPPAPDPAPAPGPATDPPPTVPDPTPALPVGSVDVPVATTTPVVSPPGDSTNLSAGDSTPAAPGTTNSQSADVTTGGSAVADTGSNTGVAVVPGGGTPGTGSGGSQSGVQTGTANGQGSVDQSGISQQVSATVTENGQVVVVQVAIIVNIGIGIAGSGGNLANAESGTPPQLASSVGTIVGSEAAGAGTGPTPAQIDTGMANATGNVGTTTVTQSIVLTGNDVASQLATVLNLGVGVSNSGLNFALAAISGNNTGAPSSVTFITMGGGSFINAGSAGALGNRSSNAVFQVVTVSASGNGSLLVIQRAIIVNFGLALANSGLNVAGGGALNAAMPDAATVQQLLLMLLDPGAQAPGSGVALDGAGGGAVSIGTGGALAVGNDTTTGIRQQVAGSIGGNDTARAIQDAWVGNFGIGIANSGGNTAAAGLVGIDPSSLAAARGALQAFLAGLTGLGDPLQGLDANFQLGANLLQLHGDVSGTESLLGITQPGTQLGPDDASVVVRQVTAVLNIGLALGDSGHNVAISISEGTTSGGPGTTVAGATITTGDALATGNHFAATICQAIGDSVTCAAPTPPPENPPPDTPVVVPELQDKGPQPLLNPINPISPSHGIVRPATLPFTGSPIGAELAAGSGLLVAGMLMARRRRSGVRT
ncbi:MAG: beta strand repeat-containing protein [Acidimicrobiia bacterium]